MEILNDNCVKGYVEGAFKGNPNICLGKPKGGYAQYSKYGVIDPSIILHLRQRQADGKWKVTA